MKSLAIIVLSVLVAVQAQFPMGGGYLPVGGGFGSGYNNLNNAYQGGQGGYQGGGYGGGMSNVQHDIGGQESDFDSAVHQHQASAHDIGGAMTAGQQGGGYGGYNGYGSGMNNMGSGYQQGGYGGFGR